MVCAPQGAFNERVQVEKGARKAEKDMVSINKNVAEFTFYRPSAERVCLVGDFNGWRQNELWMSRDKHGYWRAYLHLPPGEYKFRYLADGSWYTDYAAFGVAEGLYGLDSVLWVPPQQENRTVA